MAPKDQSSCGTIFQVLFFYFLGCSYCYKKAKKKPPKMTRRQYVTAWCHEMALGRSLNLRIEEEEGKEGKEGEEGEEGEKEEQVQSFVVSPRVEVPIASRVVLVEPRGGGESEGSLSSLKSSRCASGASKSTQGHDEEEEWRTIRRESVYASYTMQYPGSGTTSCREQRINDNRNIIANSTTSTVNITNSNSIVTLTNSALASFSPSPTTSPSTTDIPGISNIDMGTSSTIITATKILRPPLSRTFPALRKRRNTLMTIRSVTPASPTPVALRRSRQLNPANHLARMTADMTPPITNHAVLMQQSREERSWMFQRPPTRVEMCEIRKECDTWKVDDVGSMPISKLSAAAPGTVNGNGALARNESIKAIDSFTENLHQEGMSEPLVDIGRQQKMGARAETGSQKENIQSIARKTHEQQQQQQQQQRPQGKGLKKQRLAQLKQQRQDWLTQLGMKLLEVEQQYVLRNRRWSSDELVADTMILPSRPAPALVPGSIPGLEETITTRHKSAMNEVSTSITRTTLLF